MPPHLYTPCTFVHPHMFVCPQGCTQPPRGPPCFLCSCMVLEHCVLLGVFFCPPSLGWLGHISSSAVHMLIFFVVHYVSCVDHSSDYYSSSYSGIFWPVISIISVSGSFPDRGSSKPWCGSTTTLDAEELWRWSWLHFCVAAANSIFNASSGLCQLCYGFSTGRFLFQS